MMTSVGNVQSVGGEAGQRIALAGLGLYVLFAPHSVAASAIGVAIASLGWLLRTLQTRSFGLRWSKFDLLIVLSLLWTVASALLSEEPRISAAKLQASWCVLLFYLARATLTRKSALVLVALLIMSASAGALYSAFDLLRGRGVVVESIATGSPFHHVGIRAGDTIWQINRRRVYSTTDLDRILSEISPNTPVTVGIITQGEQVERSFTLMQSSASGIAGTEHNHRFRASGWTRHYETFAELMQMIAQLALGLALAHLRNHGPNRIFRIAIIAAALLTAGLVFTAMRTVIVAFVIGASVMALRSLRATLRVVFTFALFAVLAFAAVVVWQTRDRGALLLDDPSSSLRLQVARVGLSRIPIHPLFGHGMDAMQLHWNEWGFPGKDMLHLHSTPLQLAFDRGLPMLALWLWLVILFWLTIARAERSAAERGDTNYYGILLGTLGALTGFLMSALVNYNYGDAEVAMMFWFLMGIALSTDYADSSPA
jgi:O-antigen ligase/polysaccharide polymerase Wzy-like membrane protein/PDZ domain-containing protein